MKAFLLLVGVSIMASVSRQVHCESYSESCSSINGKMVCTRQQGPGNMAGSSAIAQTGGGGGGYMGSNAAVGDSNTGTVHYAQQEANIPPTFTYDTFVPPQYGGNPPPQYGGQYGGIPPPQYGGIPQPENGDNPSPPNGGYASPPNGGNTEPTNEGNPPPQPQNGASYSSSSSGSFAGAGPYTPFFNPYVPNFAPYPSDQARPVPQAYPVFTPPGAFAGPGGAFAGAGGAFAGAGGNPMLGPMAFVQNAMNGMMPFGPLYGRR